MLPALLLYVSLVNDVRSLIARHDLVAAERATRAFQSQAGNTPEVAAAFSWLARGALEAKQLELADRHASEARKLSTELLRTRKLETDPWLPTALGASIEVHAQVLAAQGERAEAVQFLRQQLAAYRTTAVGERIRKNLNLLDLEGKTAPALDASDWIGDIGPNVSLRRGQPVLLFFWAHWCGDCKAEGRVIASLMKTWGPKGLLVVAPTKLYGYVAGGEDANPAVEKKYIRRIRDQYYPELTGVPTPLSSANFLTYGASTTPTVVLVDGKGIVRLFHPGAMTEPELSTRIQKVLGK